jgi:hypothetical protein
MLGSDQYWRCHLNCGLAQPYREGKQRAEQDSNRSHQDWAVGMFSQLPVAFDQTGNTSVMHFWGEVCGP